MFSPTVALSEKCLAVLGHPASYRVLLTISHDNEYAIAQTVLVRTVMTTES